LWSLEKYIRKRKNKGKPIISNSSKLDYKKASAMLNALLELNNEIVQQNKLPFNKEMKQLLNV
jgi:hypothetical protein